MKTQAWGWLVAAVLAAGLNASYHDGGLEWAHRITYRVEHNANAVLALATGHADQFLAEAQLVTAHNETSPCPFATVLTRAQNRIARRENDFARFESISAREESQFARIESAGARVEARFSRLPALAATPLVIRVPKIDCPRVRVSVPTLPQIKMPMMPVIHIDSPGAGPV